MRAVHIEMSYFLSTDAFINILRRFVNRRSKLHAFWSDNSTNLVGGYQELDQSKVNEQLRQKEIIWNFNPPLASHMGGVWERVIRSIRRILCALLKEQTLTDDFLSTLFAEIEFIINSRPLTPVVLDFLGEEPLTPNHLLLLRLSDDHSTGIFTSDDNYVRKRWHQVQYLAEQFWIRLRREYLQALQTRVKWQKPQPKFNIGDIVLLHDVSRGKWPLARIINTFPDN